MSEPVNPNQMIEAIVGAPRAQTVHIARAVSSEQKVYVLHSQDCRDSRLDLTFCTFSLALDAGIEDGVWSEWGGQEDAATPVRIYGLTIRRTLSPDHVRLGRAGQVLNHGLADEGAAHDLGGNRKAFQDWRWSGVAGVGRAMCACGALSPELPSAYQRRKWHRTIHKPEIATWATGG